MTNCFFPGLSCLYLRIQFLKCPLTNAQYKDEEMKWRKDLAQWGMRGYISEFQRVHRKKQSRRSFILYLGLCARILECARQYVSRLLLFHLRLVLSASSHISGVFSVMLGMRLWQKHGMQEANAIQCSILHCCHETTVLFRLGARRLSMLKNKILLFSRGWCMRQVHCVLLFDCPHACTYKMLLT